MNKYKHMPPTSNSTKRSHKCSKRHMSRNTSGFSALNHSRAAYARFPFIFLECHCRQISKVTVLAVKQLNAEELEMLPKAHEPKHLKHLCVEPLNSSICSFANHAHGVLVQAPSKVTVLAIKHFNAKRSSKCSQRHMTQNTSSFSALKHSTAAWVLFLFVPLEYWCKQLQR